MTHFEYEINCVCLCVFMWENHSPTQQCYNSVKLTFTLLLTATSSSVIFNVKSLSGVGSMYTRVRKDSGLFPNEASQKVKIHLELRWCHWEKLTPACILFQAQAAV